MNSEELKAFLNKHKLNDTRLAEVLGVSQPAVNMWLNGHRGISKPISRLLKTFDKYPQLIQEFGK